VLSLALAASIFATPGALPPITREPQILYLDRGGALIGVRGGHVSPPVDIDRLPPYVPAAFVAIEDRRFYEHNGFDAVGMARALVADVVKGRTAQGASTITQQLARNLFLSPDQTIERKAQELVYATQLEQKFSKKQILGLYLSRVYFGSGAYGIEAASRRFFDKPAAKLTLHEAAMLAGILKNPAGYSPIKEPERSAERTRLVLAAMVETGAITEAQRAKALASRPRVYEDDPALAAQYFLDWLDPQVRRAVGSYNQDLVVDTTLDLPMERAGGATLANVVENDRTKDEQGALVAMDGQGRIRAMVGGSDYSTSPYNRAVNAHRQAGSSWKPFVYLTAMEQGRTPDVEVVDEPVTINGWSPRNHDDRFLGPITLETALAKSVNTVAARLADEFGRDRVADTARRLGITTPISTDPAMALGASEVTPLDMTTAYSAFANGGQRVYPYGIERIRAGGRVLFSHHADAQPQVITNPSLGEMDRMMRAVVTSGTGVGAAIPRYDIAGKTGTTTEGKDAWFCGFTGNFTACAWVGKDDARPVPHLAGGGSAARVWKGFMLAALPRAGAGAIPPGPPAATPTPAPLNPVVTPASTLAPAPAAQPTSAIAASNDPVRALLNDRSPAPTETSSTPTYRAPKPDR
jgi:penicillin-binding protein 1A